MNRSARRIAMGLAWLGLVAAISGCRPGPQLDERLSGPVVRAATPPPAISGGTLLVLTDGTTAVVADPDRDRIVVVDLPSRAIVREALLAHGSEPGRLAEDDAGRVHVALRGTGELASFEPRAGAPELRHACAMPRGVAFDPSTGHVLVACRGGELVSFSPAGGPALRSLTIAPDLRDVLVVGGRRFVTTFRTASLIEVAPDGTVGTARTPADAVIDGGGATPDTYVPAIAWRTVVVPGTTTLAMVHQRARTSSIAVSAPSSAPATTAGYGASTSSVVTCRSSVVHGTVTFFDLDGATRGGAAIPMAVLPVDVAASPGRVAIAVAGNQAGERAVVTASEDDLAFSLRDDGCARFDDRGGANVPIAVAFDGAGDLLVLERDPSVLVVGADRIALGGADVFDTGHALFHGNVGEQVACASCHPEGGEDGQTWTFDGIARRTQSIGGGVSATAPFHWNGEEPTFDALVRDVFVARMHGPSLSGEQTEALASFVDTIPSPRTTDLDAAALARGQASFEGVADCASCHSGAHFTDGMTRDVGTGGAFQVPSLNGVSHRLPLMHDGCATTLERRFDVDCGGDAHGNASSLDAAQRADLMMFLRSI